MSAADRIKEYIASGIDPQTAELMVDLSATVHNVTEKFVSEADAGDVIDSLREQGWRAERDGCFAAAGLIDSAATEAQLQLVLSERVRQDTKWGQQSNPDGTGLVGSKPEAHFRKRVTDEHMRLGTCTWRHILDEEVAEAYAETDPDKLMAELHQVAAVAIAWAEDIARREAVNA